MVAISVPLHPFHSMACHARPCQNTAIESTAGPPSKLAVVNTKGPRAQMAQQPCFSDTVPRSSRRERRGRQGRAPGARGPWAVAIGDCLLRLVSMGCGLWIEFVVSGGKSFPSFFSAAGSTRQFTVPRLGGNGTQSCQLKRSGSSRRTQSFARGRAAARLQLPT